MIHIVSDDNRHLYISQIKEMFRLRYAYFVLERGWKLQHENGMEKDQYDTASTVYLMKLAEDGTLLGSFRFMPTTKPYPMTGVVPTGLRWPEGPNVWEASRGMMRPDRRTFPMLAEFCTGIVEFALIWGIDRMVCTIDPSFLSTSLGMGWDVRPIGDLFELDGEVFLPAELRIGRDTLQAVRKVSGLSKPIIAYNRAIPCAA